MGCRKSFEFLPRDDVHSTRLRAAGAHLDQGCLREKGVVNCQKRIPNRVVYISTVGGQKQAAIRKKAPLLAAADVDGVGATT